MSASTRFMFTLLASCGLMVASSSYAVCEGTTWATRSCDAYSESSCMGLNSSCSWHDASMTCSGSFTDTQSCSGSWDRNYCESMTGCRWVLPPVSIRHAKRFDYVGGSFVYANGFWNEYKSNGLLEHKFKEESRDNDWIYAYQSSRNMVLAIGRNVTMWKYRDNTTQFYKLYDGRLK